MSRKSAKAMPKPTETATPGKQPPVMAFASQVALRAWLVENHRTSRGIWLRLFKKSSGKETVSRQEAVDEALCFGWIDGQVKSFDEESWLIRYTPRGPKSAWSKRNTEHVQRLMKAGAMTEAGLEAVNAAKADGRWDAAYQPASEAKPPDDFVRELRKNNQARAFFETLSRANIYAIVYRLETAAKPATRARRMQTIIAMLADGKTFHPQKSSRASAKG